MIRRLLAYAVATAAIPAAAASEPPRDWAATLRSDARALHDRIAADHPGPYNRLDPGFARRNDAALALATRRARQVRDFPGYLWAMRGYVASFNDGHVQFALDKPAVVPTRWPGFLTGFDANGRQVVMSRADDAAIPLGAELIACDGVAADWLAARNVGAFRGLWQLASQRSDWGGRLFVDARNPFIALPRHCRFRVNGRVRRIDIAWRALPEAEFGRRVGAITSNAHPDFAMRTLSDGTRWLTMPSFDSDPAGAAAKALASMLATMRGERAALSATPRIVLDVRGNGGGSSLWSYDIAKVLWGVPAVARYEITEAATYAEWRVSPANLATVETYRDTWRKAPAASPDALRWADTMTTGLTTAIAAGQHMWRAPDDPPPPPDRTAATVAPTTTTVYVLTDGACASACLDAVDIWTTLGAIPVGRETSADTLYMEVGDRPLPSGVGEIGVPMKVYRGRRRGSNVPVAPRYRYPGDMNDTAALERWIASLPAG